MFDDDNPKSGQTPNNLPTEKSQTEPEDMFEGVDSSESDSEIQDRSPERKTAMDAGKIREKEAVSSNGAQNTGISDSGKNVAANSSENLSQDISSVKQSNKMTEPVMNKGVLTVVIVLVVLLVLGGGGWFVYANFVSGGDEDTPASNKNDQVVNTTTQKEDEDETKTGTENEAQQKEESSTKSENTSNQILYGDEKDTDEDLLSDSKEEKIGTDPNNWDTDNDKLGDGQEVLNWDTDPLNPDTDGDGYKDGDEIKSGYSPLGKGKLFQPPTSSNSTSS